MSCYLKFSGWTGEDASEATARLAKMFRMDSGEAHQAMRKIMEGQNWQFQQTISDEQAQVAQTYLSSQGFDLELISTSHPDLTPVSDTQFVEEAPAKKSWLDFLKPKPKKPAVQAEAEEEKPKAKTFFGISLTRKK